MAMEGTPASNRLQQLSSPHAERAQAESLCGLFLTAFCSRIHLASSIHLGTHRVQTSELNELRRPLEHTGFNDADKSDDSRTPGQGRNCCEPDIGSILRPSSQQTALSIHTNSAM